jgi:rubrerythrin
VQKAITLEETVLRFYRQAADKMPVREVAHVFTRMADETEGHLQDLHPLQG